MHAWRQSVCPSALTLALGEERLKGGDDLHKLLPARQRNKEKSQKSSTRVFSEECDLE